jgi:outer membrane protein
MQQIFSNHPWRARRTQIPIILAALVCAAQTQTSYGQAAGNNGAGTAGNGSTGAAGNTGASGTTGIGGQGTTGATSQGTAGMGTSSTSTGVSSNGNGKSGQASGAATGSLPLRTTDGQTMFDMGQTVSAAIASSSDLQIAARSIQIDEKRSDEAAAGGRPNLGLNGVATRFDQPTTVAFPGGGPITFLHDHREQLSINLSDQIDLTGQIRAATDQAKLQSLSDRFDYTYIQNQRILRAKTIYFNLLRAQHQVQVANSALITAQRQLQDAQNLNAAQVGQKIDVYRATTQVANAQQQLTAAQNQLDIARANFNDLVGRTLNLPVQVADVPGVNIGINVSQITGVGSPPPLDFTPFNVPPAEIDSIDLDKSLDTAYTHRPELLSDQVNIRVEEKGITLARSGLQPTLRLDAAGNYFPTTSFQDIRRRTAAVTATLSIPLYDGGATRDRVQEAHLRTQNAQTTLDSDKSDISLDVRQSYLNLATAARQISAVNTALQQAIAARQLAQVRYEGQVGTYLEVTDAQSALVQAENSQVNAVYDYFVARAQFENSIGVPQIR